ncbi:HXXEE domain-containing protein [candidate division KSB1 bacterium]|nr:HXXEE domain-containing protein [candidate division KSB1 bacterium]
MIIRFFSNKIVVFILFAFVFTPGIFWNTLFHAGATIRFGVYCPGLFTALILYLPLFFFISRLAYREGLLTETAGLIALLLAGIFHVVEVGHNVFKAW